MLEEKFGQFFTDSDDDEQEEEVCIVICLKAIVFT